MTSRLLIFTDLDGALIDFDTYSIEEARSMVQALQRAEATVVFCSSKTFVEQRALQEAFGIATPCIVENGSAIVAPASFWKAAPAEAFEKDGWLWIDLGLAAVEIRRRVCKIECEIGESLQGFSTMAPEDVTTVTGLDLVSARRAQSRDFSETLAVRRPGSFWKEIDPLFAKRGLSCMSGGRFRTAIAADVDKGRAVDVFVRTLEADTGRTDYLSVGIGDSPNDRDLLKAADVAYQVMTAQRTWHEIDAEDVVRVSEVGPKGWAKAIGALLRSNGLSVGAAT